MGIAFRFWMKNCLTRMQFPIDSVTVQLSLWDGSSYRKTGLPRCRTLFLKTMSRVKLVYLMKCRRVYKCILYYTIYYSIQRLEKKHVVSATACKLNFTKSG